MGLCHPYTGTSLMGHAEKAVRHGKMSQPDCRKVTFGTPATYTFRTGVEFPIPSGLAWGLVAISCFGFQCNFGT